MNDPEWERLKTTFHQGGRPMPYAVAKARANRTLTIVGISLVYAIFVPMSWLLVGELRKAQSLFDTLSALVVAAMMMAILIRVHVSLRGTWGDPGAAPLAQLAALEQRHRGRLRLARFMPWCVGSFVAALVAITVAQAIAKRHVNPSDLIALVGMAAITIPPSWLGIALVRKRVVRELAEIDEARRLLNDDEPPANNP